MEVDSVKTYLEFSLGNKDSILQMELVTFKMVCEQYVDSIETELPNKINELNNLNVEIDKIDVNYSKYNIAQIILEKSFDKIIADILEFIKQIKTTNYLLNEFNK